MKWLALVSVLAALCVEEPAREGVIRHDTPDSLYVNLARQPQFAAVGRIVAGGSSQIGNGVLIEASWLITARHVTEEKGITSISVEFDGRRYEVDRVIRHHEADLALLHLSKPVEDVVPAVRYRGNAELGMRGVTVGYGLTGRGDETYHAVLKRYDYASLLVKRAGENIIDEIEDGHILQADFDHPSEEQYNMTGAAEPLPLEYFPMTGDSGGGLFIEVSGSWLLAGITVSGSTPRIVYDGNTDPFEAFLYGWMAQWHRVSDVNGWIARHLE